MFGQKAVIKMPSDDDIEKMVEEIFKPHEKRIKETAFDLKSARSSYDKIIKKEPPNSKKNQQFKDGVI